VGCVSLPSGYAATPLSSPTSSYTDLRLSVGPMPSRQVPLQEEERHQLRAASRRRYEEKCVPNFINIASYTNYLPETKNAAGRPPNCACKGNTLPSHHAFLTNLSPALEPRSQRLITTPNANIANGSQPTRRATATGERCPLSFHPDRQQLAPPQA
jgi:hypothetical protein